ncbi:hypothetical protein ABSB03_000743 [Salmonella enterica]
MAAYDIEKDIGPRVQIIQEIHELILAGEMEVAKGMLRTLIKVTFAYPAIFDEVRQECQICKSTEFAQRHGREGIKLMGQKFFDIHESSRFNMSFKCSGEFNIIYIMRTNIVEAQC